MTRILQFTGLVLLAAGCGLAEQNAGRAAAPLRKVLPPKAGPRLTNPRNLAARLYAARPEERERVLEKLPPAQQERARRQLEWFDGLPKEQQDLVLRRAERLESLPPERRLEFERSLRAFQQLAPERHQAVNMALRRLQMLPPPRRRLLMESMPFRERFSPEEQKIVRDLLEIMVPPPEDGRNPQN